MKFKSKSVHVGMSSCPIRILTLPKLKKINATKAKLLEAGVKFSLVIWQSYSCRIILEKSNAKT
jgi:hypothetical protein